MVRHRIACTAVALCVLGASSVAAQDAPPARSELAAGAWALQFGIANNFTLEAFQGSTISAKYHLAPNRAIRFGASAEARFRETVDTQDFAVAAQYLLYPRIGRRGALYVGAGPAIALSRSDPQTGDSDTDWELGADAAIGAEWFAAADLSFHAEYGWSIRYQHGASDTRIDSAPVRFGVSVWF